MAWPVRRKSLSQHDDDDDDEYDVMLNDISRGIEKLRPKNVI